MLREVKTETELVQAEWVECLISSLEIPWWMMQKLGQTMFKENMGKNQEQTSRFSQGLALVLLSLLVMVDGSRPSPAWPSLSFAPECCRGHHIHTTISVPLWAYGHSGSQHDKTRYICHPGRRGLNCILLFFPIFRDLLLETMKKTFSLQVAKVEKLDNKFLSLSLKKKKSTLSLFSYSFSTSWLW